MTYEDFSDIAPFDDNQFPEQIAQLVTEPGFEHAVRWVFPDIDYSEFVNKLKSIDNEHDFQLQVMVPFLEFLAKKTTSGISSGGIGFYNKDTAYTMITNHRDIVLDASFLNLCLVSGGLPTCQVAIGNNLLIYPWIDSLVRINKSFIVKRDSARKQALDAARHLSGYIHYSITQKHDSVWIAHREGRAKDSNDVTQESLIKMLGLGGDDGASFVNRIKEINLMPVAISYEFDPNDYWKAREFLLKRKNPEYKKTQRDDLFSMETGLLQFKGRVHFELTECLNSQLDKLDPGMDRADAVKLVCTMVDRAIHANYRIYPINYIAYDELHGSDEFSDRYTESDVKKVDDYLNSQLAKVDIPDLSADDMAYMRKLMLTMYANPLQNQLKVLQ